MPVPGTRPTNHITRTSVGRGLGACLDFADANAFRQVSLLVQASSSRGNRSVVDKYSAILARTLSCVTNTWWVLV